MNIIIPMAGAGSRFSNEGYKVHKPAILTTDRRSGLKVPMVVAAALDIPNISKSNLYFIDRDFHKNDGVEELILKHFPNAKFKTIDFLTDGQASTCLLMKNEINNDQELFISGCDNGMVLNHEKFDEAKLDADCLVFTYRNHDLVLAKPEAHGWVIVDGDSDIATGVSVKKPISDTPMNDHAIVASFWFKKGKDFILAAEKMVDEKDKINDEYYVDQVIKHALGQGLRVKVFEIDKYLCWGTPKDYEEYENTINYWSEFLKEEGAL